MSISLGLYDVFSYAVPGMFYLYLVNEILKLIGWYSLDWGQLSQSGVSAPNALVVLVLGVGAFNIGHIFETIRSILLDKKLYNDGPDQALRKIDYKGDY